MLERTSSTVFFREYSMSEVESSKGVSIADHNAVGTPEQLKDANYFHP